MKLICNGELIEIKQVENLEEALQEIQPQFPYSIVLNAEFIPRSLIAQTSIKEGDHIEIVQPLFGG